MKDKNQRCHLIQSQNKQAVYFASFMVHTQIFWWNAKRPLALGAPSAPKQYLVTKKNNILEQITHSPLYMGEGSAL